MKQPIPIHKGHVPFARFLLALSVGIAVGYFTTPDPLHYTIVCWLLVGSLLAFVSLVLGTRLRNQRYYGLMGLFLGLALVTWGYRSTWATHPEIDPLHFSRAESRVLIGNVKEEPVVRNRQLRFPFEVNRASGANGMQDVTGTLMVTISLTDGELPPPIDYGDELLIPAQYRLVPPPYNPGELDYQAYLANQNIWHQAYFRSQEIYKTGERNGNPLVIYLLKSRKKLVAKFERYLVNRDALAVASTLILGDRANLSVELLQAFSNTGTIHVLSVSGMHVVIVFWLFAKLLGWMDVSRSLRTVKFILLVSAVWGYAALTGFSPSVLRASVMISFVMSATAFNRENRIYNSLSASAFFLLLYDPKFLADIGFQLSYLAVLGIVFLTPLWKLIFTSNHRVIKPIGDYIGMSISAQAGAGPLAAYYFHQFPMYFLLANLVIALPVSGIMYLGFLLLIIPKGALAFWVGGLLEQLILFVNTILFRIEQLPMAVLQGIWIDVWGCVWVYALLLSVTYAFVNRSKPWFYSMLAVVTVLTCTASVAAFRGQAPDQMIIFNVRRQMAIGMISNGEAWVYSNLTAFDNPTIHYAVLPGMERLVPRDRIHLVSSDRDFSGEKVYINEPFVQFGNARLMVCDRCEISHPKEQLDVDVLLIRNNPTLSLKDLFKHIRCKQLVLDGSNHRFTIERLIAEAEASDVPWYVLKNNVAWTYQERD